MDTALTIAMYVSAVGYVAWQYVAAKYRWRRWRGSLPGIAFLAVMGGTCLVLGELPVPIAFAPTIGLLVHHLTGELSQELRRLAQEEHERDVAEFRERQSRARKFH